MEHKTINSVVVTIVASGSSYDRKSDIARRKYYGKAFWLARRYEYGYGLFAVNVCVRMTAAVALGFVYMMPPMLQMRP